VGQPVQISRPVARNGQSIGAHVETAHCGTLRFHRRRAEFWAAGKNRRQLIYRIDGSENLREEILPHFEGYMKSAPVRIGNNAHRQLQLDIYGKLMDSIYLFNNMASRFPMTSGRILWRW